MELVGYFENISLQSKQVERKPTYSTENNLQNAVTEPSSPRRLFEEINHVVNVDVASRYIRSSNFNCSILDPNLNHFRISA